MGRTGRWEGRRKGGPDVIGGRYLLLDRIAGGGMSTVWRGYDLREREYVAAKVLSTPDPAGLLRFVAEQSLRVRHPHVVSPTGWAADDDVAVFVMPLVPGGTLEDLLRRHGPLPAAYVAELLRQLLEALDAVHRAGVVHRDIKPANLLLEATGTGPPLLRLADFGVSVRHGRARLTQGGGVVGTEGYMPPEQRDGARPAPGHDLYAAGVVAREALTGRRPGSVPRGELGELLARLTDPDPARRPASAREALTALAAQTGGAELHRPGQVSPRHGAPGPDTPDVPDRLGPPPPLPRPLRGALSVTGSPCRAWADIVAGAALVLALVLSTTALLLAVGAPR